MRDKASLRRHYRQLRRTIPTAHEAICGAALSFVRRTTKETSVVGLYWPLDNEVDLRPLRTQLPNPVALPQADGKGCLRYGRWSGQVLKKDGCGIPAPTNSSNLRPEEISLLLVPALAVDSSGIRLGYGGGYYDRLRSDPLWADVPAWVVLPSQCVQFSPLPRDSWDVPFNGWITEQGPGQLLRPSAS
ncbi:5-formyltetrahydrofolate cyclo-ligase [Synechococcus sp. BL107]|jgi:5,10-methenyltetrahydrofolate synthetase|uniref:5-formyltetrahydrofolate cyclo-ligase n=1 Tax=Synechococcus sp. BL107 TaxID=313625 RepID=UPI00030D73D4|nr:5-formyltetrahydrofolate cyclo-ligase [Synechococcus sp. BL107]|tara:strand:+ start:488 stop:1051 length:564 start_codon:yes stop_codon:yes gene_type:complete